LGQIDRPTFDSQSKEVLTTSPKDFGSQPTLSSAFLRDVAADSGIVEAVVESAVARQHSELQRGSKRATSARRTRLNIPKLEDANAAGGAKAADCTLILTEGDSAKVQGRCHQRTQRPGTGATERAGIGDLTLRGGRPSRSPGSPRSGGSATGCTPSAENF